VWLRPAMTPSSRRRRACPSDCLRTHPTRRHVPRLPTGSAGAAAFPAAGRIRSCGCITGEVSCLSPPVEPGRFDRDASVGDAGDSLIERLTAIALVVDPMPSAVLEDASRLFETASSGASSRRTRSPLDGSFSPMWRTSPEPTSWGALCAALDLGSGRPRVRRGPGGSDRDIRIPRAPERAQAVHYLRKISPPVDDLKVESLPGPTVQSYR